MADATVPIPTNQSTASATPLWYDQLAQQFGNTVSGAVTNAAGLGGNWYNQPLTAGLTTQQQNIIGQAPGTAGQWQTPFQGALTQVQQASQWDPAKMQQHMNPYVTGVMDEIARRGNLNLTENIMPNVNRTFTGAGMFGSAGNADFLQRAVRDTQGEILGAQAKTGLQAHQQAAQDYYNWGELGTQGGQVQGNMAVAGQGQAWGDLEKQYALQEQQRENTQKGLTANYEDWQKQLATPVSMLGALSQMTSQFPSLYKGAQTQITTPVQPASNNLNDLLVLLSSVSRGAAGTQ